MTRSLKGSLGLLLFCVACTKPSPPLSLKKTLYKKIEHIEVTVSTELEKTQYRLGRGLRGEHFLSFGEKEVALEAKIPRADFLRFREALIKKEGGVARPCKGLEILVDFFDEQKKLLFQNKACGDSSLGKDWLRLLQGAHASFVAHLSSSVGG